jgi:hypothetical protein
MDKWEKLSADRWAQIIYEDLADYLDAAQGNAEHVGPRVTAMLLRQQFRIVLGLPVTFKAAEDPSGVTDISAQATEAKDTL